MAGESVDTISGSAASALLATAPAATASPAPLKNLLRVNMCFLDALRCSIAEQCRVEFRLGDPEIAHALDVVIDARDLAARIRPTIRKC